MDPSFKIHIGTEIIVLRAICVSSVNFSDELESIISIYENHYRDKRPMSETGIAEEFQITITVPSLAH